MELEKLPGEIADAIQKGASENELIQMANRLLEKGDQENAARVLELCI